MPERFLLHTFSSMFLRAPTTKWPDVFIEILLAVVVGKLFTRPDVPACIDKNMTAFYLRFAVGTTRMIDIPGDICAYGAVDRPTCIYLEEVLAAARVGFGIRYRSPDVFDNAFPFLERTRGEESKPGTRLPHPNSFGVIIFLRTHMIILVYHTLLTSVYRIQATR